MIKNILLAREAINVLLFLGAVLVHAYSALCVTLLEISFAAGLIAVVMTLWAAYNGCSYLERFRHSNLLLATADVVFDLFVMSAAIVFGWHLLLILAVAPYLLTVIVYFMAGDRLPFQTRR